MSMLIFGAILLSMSITLSMAVDNIAVGALLLGLLLTIKSFRFRTLDFRVLSITFIGFLTSILSINPIESIKQSRYLWHFIPYFALSRMNIKKIPLVVNLLGIFSILGSFGVILGSFTHTSPGRFITKEGFINFFMHLHFYAIPSKSEGFLSMSLTTAGILAPITLLFLSLIVFSNKNKIQRSFYLAVFLINLLGFTLTFERSYWLGFGTAILLLPLFLREKRAVIASFSIIIIATLSFIFIPKIHQRVISIVHYEKNDSALDRLAMWRGGLEFYSQAPIKIKLFGVGTGFINEYDKKDIIKNIKDIYGPNVDIAAHLHSSLHNVYLQLLTEWGMIGLLVWIYVWLYVMKKNISFINSTHNDFYRAVIIGLSLGFISLFIGGFFENNVGDAEVIIFAMYLLGINGNILEEKKL